MTRNIHSMDESWHFGELYASRVLTEDMTRFNAGTPLEEVLQYIHDRLTIMENGELTVDAFSINAWTLIPSFTIDAVIWKEQNDYFTLDARIPLTPIIDTFVANARIQPAFKIDAIIRRPGPDAVVHQDSFTNDWIDSWGVASDVPLLGEYTYSNATHESRHDKYEITGDVTDPDWPDYRGQIVEYDRTYYSDRIDDKAWLNKHITHQFVLERGNEVGGTGVYLYYDGGNAYIHMNAKGGGLGTDFMRLYVGGVARDEYYGDSGGIFNIWTYGFPWVVEMEHQGNWWKGRWYQPGTTPPDWSYGSTAVRQVQWEDTAGVYVVSSDPRSGFQLRGQGRSIPYDPGGSPWTHLWKDYTITSLGAGPFTIDSFVQPYFTMDAQLIRGGVFKIDAFVLPTFRISAFLVETIESAFTLDAVIPLDVYGTINVDAFIDYYFKMDAWLTVPQVYEFTINADLVGTVFDDWTADAVKTEVFTNGLTINAVKKIWDVPGSFTIDAELRTPGDPWTIDAIVGRSFWMDAMKHEDGITKGYTIDARINPYPTNPRDILISARIHDPKTFAIAAVIKQTGTHWSHYDDFNDRTITPLATNTLTVKPASFVGHYTDTESSSTYEITSGQLHYREEIESGYIYLEDTDGHDVDRDYYLEINRESNSGPSIGDFYYYPAGNMYIVNHLNGSVYQMYINGVLQGSLNPGTTGWVAIHVRIQNSGTEVYWNVWNRATGPDGYPGDHYEAWHTVAPGVITDARAALAGASASWFGQGSPPFDHYIDNVKVWNLSGGPRAHTMGLDAVIFGTQTKGFTIDALANPVPFTIDAFIQGWFLMDARIWLGTTFSMDAIIKRTDKVFGDYTLIPGGSVGSNGGTTFWQYNSAASIQGPETAKVAGGSSSNGSIKSKEIFGPITDREPEPNYFPGSDDFGTTSYSRSWSFYHSSLPRDTLRAGVYDASIGLGNGAGGFYGFTISDYSNVVVDLINGADGSSTSWTTSINGITRKFTIEYIDLGTGNSQMKIYVDDVLVRTSASFTTPTWTSGFRFGFYTAYGIVSGTDYLYYTPQFDRPHVNDGLWLDAYLQRGFWISAYTQDVVPGSYTADAVTKTWDVADTYTIDAFVFTTGEQIRVLGTIDAVISPANDQTRITQFGWLKLGDQMWGDVSPEVEQGHFGINVWIKGIYPVTIDAVITAEGYYNDAFDAQLGSARLGYMQLGQGNLELYTEENLWNYANDDEETAMTSITQFMWEQFK